MQTMDPNRRKLLLLSGAAAGLAIFPKLAKASRSTSTPKILTLNNIHTGESLKTEFFDGTRYNHEELTRLNHFFRDYRANEVTRIDPRLFDQLYRLQLLMNTRKPIQLISGYRTLETNNYLRGRSARSGVAKHSFHTQGRAMDLHIEGIPLKRLRTAALSMRSGGVGYYPRSNFIHIDTGPVRHW